METLKSNSSPDFVAILGNLAKSIQSGEFIKDPNMVLALALFCSAGLILVVCLISFFVKRSGNTADESSVYILESRIQALEVALLDQRNLAISMKNQSKADFAYFKQEMKNLYFAIEGLDVSSAPPSRRLRAASNS